MLTLNLVESQARCPKKDTFSGEMAELRQIIAKIKEEISTEEKWLAENTRIVEKAMSSDLSTLPILVKDEENRKLKLEKENKTVGAELEALKKEQEKIKDDVSYTAGKNTDIRNRLEALKLEMEEIVESLEKELEDAKKQKEAENKNIYFSFDREEGKEPILAECSAAGIRTKVIVSGEIREFSDESTSYVTVINSFLSWLDSRKNSDSEYVVFAVKPSSCNYILSLQNEVAKRKYQIGLEPIEEDMKAVH